MNRSGPRRGQQALALTGKVDGRQRLFVLNPGPNTIGRSSENDVVLAPSGVSSRHALIQVGEQAIEVTDLESKNGTFLGRDRVEAVPLEIGQNIRFGPVTLRLESVRLEDTWLSVTSARTGSRSKSNFSQTSTIASNGDAGSVDAQRLVRLLDDVTSVLGSGASSSSGRALAVLVRSVGSPGAALIDVCSDGSVIVLASCGKLVRELPSAAIQRVRARAQSGAEEQVVSIEGGELPWTVVTDHEGPSLVLAGELSTGGISGTLLRVVYRLLSRSVATRSRSSPSDRAETRLSFPETYLVGDSRAMREVYQEIASVADSGLPVLLVGETGVGKELLARTIHLSSRRRDKPFSPINCAAIPGDLLEAELFGIARGVATGVSARPGRFALAQGGTVFLDEIGDMSAALQAKLLRALEESVIQPLGGEPVEIDVRLLAATNTELGRKVESGEFREDLYYRLAGLVVTIPPLRQRDDDIGALIEHFFHQASEESGRAVAGITYGAMRELMERRWPGNVRELQHAIRRLVFQCREDRAINSAMVKALERSSLSSTDGGSSSSLPDFSVWESLDLEAISKGLLEEAMRRSNGNQTAAAALLGITRSSLRRRLAKLFAGGLPAGGGETTAKVGS